MPYPITLEWDEDCSKQVGNMAANKETLAGLFAYWDSLLWPVMQVTEEGEPSLGDWQAEWVKARQDLPIPLKARLIWQQLGQDFGGEYFVWDESRVVPNVGAIWRGKNEIYAMNTGAATPTLSLEIKQRNARLIYRTSYWMAGFGAGPWSVSRQITYRINTVNDFVRAAQVITDTDPFSYVEDYYVSPTVLTPGTYSIDAVNTPIGVAPTMVLSFLTPFIEVVYL